MRAVATLSVVVSLALWLGACAPAAPAEVGTPGTPPPPVGEQVDPPAPEAEPTEPPPTEPTEDPPMASSDGAAAAGEPCDTGEDCASGVCEGEGCEPGGGVCAPEQRACTRDLRPYCGCDGQTFRTSGSCPGRRYAYRGECK